MNYFVTLEPYDNFAFKTYIRPYVEGYQALHDQVDGWIESVKAWTLFPREGLDDLLAWVNEEGLILEGLKPCLIMYRFDGQFQPILGNVVFDYVDELGESHGLNAEQVCRVLDAIARSPYYETETIFEGCSRDNIIFDHHPTDPPKQYPKGLRRYPRRRGKG